MIKKELIKICISELEVGQLAIIIDSLGGFIYHEEDTVFELEDDYLILYKVEF